MYFINDQGITSIFVILCPVSLLLEKIQMSSKLQIWWFTADHVADVAHVVLVYPSQVTMCQRSSRNGCRAGVLRQSKYALTFDLKRDWRRCAKLAAELQKASVNLRSGNPPFHSTISCIFYVKTYLWFISVNRSIPVYTLNGQKQ